MVQAVDATSFVTASQASYKVKKTATLLKTLTANALIMGEVGVGKESLASFILPDATILDASNFEELLTRLESSQEIIITNLENSPNLKHLIDTINKYSVRVVATSKTTFDYEYINDLFSVQFDIPPLKDRVEDVPLLMKIYQEEASTLYGVNDKFSTKNILPDLSQNALSLKRQVMMHYLLDEIQDYELMEIIEKYLYKKIGTSSDYRNFIYLYEAPLIRAGLSKFKSQLQLSDKLGLNRNTLRKKISENKQYLQGVI